MFVNVNAPTVALTHARLVDGTGTPAKDDQTIVIDGERIAAVGKTGQLAIPAGALVLDRTGQTVIPGIIGLHDHLYYQQVMMYSYPKLFLAAGVTTIRTTGSRDSYQELNLRRSVDAGATFTVQPRAVTPGTEGQPSHPKLLPNTTATEWSSFRRSATRGWTKRS